MKKKVGLISIVVSTILSTSIVAESNFTMATASSGHILAMDSNGTLWAIGNNSYGELGDGTTLSKTNFVKVSVGDLNLTKIFATDDSSSNYNFAVESNGTIWAWGYNYFEMLGEAGNKLTPTEMNTTKATGFEVNGVPTDLNISTVATGFSHITLVEENGSVWSWGSNNMGQLGNGDINSSDLMLHPIEVNTTKATGFVVNGIPTDLNIVAISAGYAHTIALEANGTVWGWGKGDGNQLGKGSRTDANPNPVEANTTKATGFEVNGIPTDLNITAIATHSASTIALEANGSVWGWGSMNPNYGQLGIGIEGLSNSIENPVEVNTTKATGFEVNGVLTDLNITAIVAGSLHTVALEANGSVWAWGFNNKGQLGDGTTTKRYNPVEVNLSTSKGWYYDANITKIFSNQALSATLAIDVNGTLIGWGRDYKGQFGYGTTTNKTSPVIIGVHPSTIVSENNLTKTLSWSAPMYSIKKYSIYRGTSDSGPFTKIVDRVENNVTTYVDSTAEFNTDYYYIIKANYDRFGTFTEANSSTTKVNFTITLPTVTTSSGSLESDTTIKSDINWTNSELNNLTNTKIYYKKSSDSSYTTVSDITTTSTTYTLTGLTPNTSYSIIVGETNSSIGEINSTASTFTTRHTPPYNITASATTNSITLYWSDGSFGNIVDRRRGGSSAYYRIYKDGIVLTQSLPSSTTSYQVTGLSPSTTYKFIVSEYGTVVNRRRDVSQESEYKSSEISFTTLAEPVVVQTSLITSNIESITKDEQKVKQEENDNSFINSADLTNEDGTGTKVVLETPKEGSDITSKTLTLDYSESGATAKTTLATDKDVDVTVNIDGSFIATKIFEDKKVIANGDSKGETSIEIENSSSKQNINIPKGADVKIENNIAKVVHTLKAQTKEVISELKVEIEADPTKSVTVKANYNNNGKEESTTYTTPSDVIDAKVDFIPANENGTYSGITAIIKTTNNLSLSEEKRRNQRVVTTTTTLNPDTTIIIGTTAWQKYDERVYFDGRRTITLLLGGAKILRDGQEETMIQGVEYELIPSTNIDTTITTNNNLIANEKSLTPIYTNAYLNIQKGWNLISNPIDKELNIANTFKYASSTFKYSGSWKQNPKALAQNEGMWINYSRHISEKIEGDSYFSDFVNATDGWNLFGAGRDINLNELSSFSQVWAYSAKDKEWVKNPNTIYRGYGFWAKF